MGLERCVAIALLVPLAFAAVPDVDRRNAKLPDHNTHFSLPVYATRSAWETRKRRIRNQILTAAGLLPLPQKGPLRPRITKRIDRDDYSIEAVLIETLPGYFLGGNLYLPKGKKGTLPAVLLPHGHWKRGRLEDQPTYSVPALGVNLARQGYVVFAYDMVGFNDTKQTPHSFGGWDEMLWSFTPLGLQLWNGTRALDFLESLPIVDRQRIAATGASGGGTQTFLLAAIDPRIHFAAPVNMISAHMQGGDPCEEAPGLRLDTSNVEIAATIAPRPMLVVSSTKDWTKNTPSEEFPALRRIYSLYGVPDRVQNAHIDAEHNYNRESREAVYHFLAKYMQPALLQTNLVDQPIQPLSDELMLALPGSGTEPELKNTEEVFEAWKVGALLQRQRKFDRGVTRQALQYVVGAEWPDKVEASIEGNGAALTRPGTGDRLTGFWRPGKGRPVVVTSRGTSAAALRTDLVDEIMRSGRPLFVLDAFMSGTQRSAKQISYNYFYSYNTSDASSQVQDILTALSFVSQYGQPELIGLGDAGIWCIFAAAVSERDLDVLADISGFGGSDQDFHDRFFVPGIQRAGGLSAALSLVNRLRAVVSSTEKVQ